MLSLGASQKGDRSKLRAFLLCDSSRREFDTSLGKEPSPPTTRFKFQVSWY